MASKEFVDEVIATFKKFGPKASVQSVAVALDCSIADVSTALWVAKGEIAAQQRS